MSSAEVRYSTFDRELLAVYLATKHFRRLLEGRSFHVLIDHKPLTFALIAIPLDKCVTSTTSRSSHRTFNMYAA